MGRRDAYYLLIHCAYEMRRKFIPKHIMLMRWRMFIICLYIWYIRDGRMFILYRYYALGTGRMFIFYLYIIHLWRCFVISLQEEDRSVLGYATNAKILDRKLAVCLLLLLQYCLVEFFPWYCGRTKQSVLEQVGFSEGCCYEGLGQCYFVVFPLYKRVCKKLISVFSGCWIVWCGGSPSVTWAIFSFISPRYGIVKLEQNSFSWGEGFDDEYGDGIVKLSFDDSVVRGV